MSLDDEEEEDVIEIDDDSDEQEAPKPKPAKRAKPSPAAAAAGAAKGKAGAAAGGGSAAKGKGRAKKPDKPAMVIERNTPGSAEKKRKLPGSMVGFAPICQDGANLACSNATCRSKAHKAVP